jgi:hypothetical protein
MTSADHPRLYLTPVGLAELQKQAQTDPVLADLTARLLVDAGLILAQEVTEFRIVGPRMLARCQQILSRVTTLALAFRLTREKKYLDRTREELFAAAAFPHWNPSHFLDVAELCTAFAIGYDWLYYDWTEADRLEVRKALVEKGLKAGVAAYEARAWWMSAASNWNLVCNGGLAIGSLAIADDEPELAQRILDIATANLPLPMASFQPDGAWEAGPDYWAYTCRYATFTIEALAMGLGSDFNLSMAPGFSQTGLFPVHCTAPSGDSYNFADAKPETRSIPALFWLGQRFHLPACINENHRRLHQQAARGLAPDAFDLIWYQPPVPEAAPLPLGAHFRRVEAFTLRSSWNDPQALFVGFKGGFNQANHGHLDLGLFVMELAGERWAMELGLDDYDLPGYFDKVEGGARWKIFCLNNRSHNTVVINGDLQRIDAKAPILRSNISGSTGFAVADLTSAYRPHVNSWLRGVKLLGGKALLIQDEIIWASQTRNVRWQMLTDAVIQLSGAEARLIRNGKALTAKILSPAGAAFSQESAEQVPPERANKGFKQLVVTFQESQPATQLCIVLSVEAVDTEIHSLESWGRE